MTTKRTVLGSDFFDRSTLAVAKDLIGKFLVRRMAANPSKGLRASEIALMITETEAYDGFRDLASHARRGKTPRNAPMFEGPGTVYVYFTYGMHWMLNLVCGKKEYPAAVLIRGVGFTEDLFPKSLRNPRFAFGKAAARLFFNNSSAPLVLNGPARLTKFLNIDKSLNGKMLGKKSGLWVEDRGVKILPRHIARTPRIGIGYAGEYVEKPWRFVLTTPRNSKAQK